MKVAVYARRSEEKDTGESIETQLKICKQYADLKYSNCSIDEYSDDDFSGKNMHRPSFDRMMKLIKRNEYSVLIFWKLDRVSRNALEFLTLHKELEKIGVNIVSVTEGFDPSTAAGKLMMIMLAAVAEMERKNISLRVTTVMNELAKKGRWSGGTPPLGYKVIKVLEGGKESPYLKEDEKGIETAGFIFDSYILNYSLHSISRMLKEKYNVNKTTTDIKRILINPVYIKYDEVISKWFHDKDIEIYNAPSEYCDMGLIRYGKEDLTNEDGNRFIRDEKEWIVAVGKHKGIISGIDYIKIYDKIHNAKRGKLGSSNNTFLNPLVHCSCGSYMRIRIQNRNGKAYKYFECYNKSIKASSCKNKMIKTEELEDIVLDMLENTYQNRDKFIKNYKNDNDNNSTEIFRNERDNINRQIKNLVKKMANSDDLQDIFLEEIRELKSELTKLNDKIDNLEREQLFAEYNKINVEGLLEGLKNIKSIINSLDSYEDKRVLIRKYIKSISVDTSSKDVKLELCL